MIETPAWYAILVRYRHETKVLQNLSAKGIEAFIPQRSMRRQWSDRLKIMQVPLFPGYIFCRFDKRHQFLVLNVPGVASIAGDNHGPIEVPATEVDSLRRLSEAEVETEQYRYVESGSETVIDEGPLSGMRVFVVNNNGVTEFIKSFHSFKQSCVIVSMQPKTGRTEKA